MSENLPAKFDPAKWQDKFKDIAEGQRKAEKSTGQFFSIKSGVLSFAGSPMPGNKVDTVVVQSIHERVYYPGRFGEGESTSPACYSYSELGEDMKPHPESVDPQAKSCKDCPHDKWGTSDNGKGKKCREGRRLALMSATDLDSPDKVASAVVAYLKVPVTSAKGFSSYTQGVVGATGLPLFMHVTRVSVVPDAKNQIAVKFERVAPIERDDVIDAIHGRAVAEAEGIMFPYPKPEPQEQAKPAKARKF